MAMVSLSSASAAARRTRAHRPLCRACLVCAVVLAWLNIDAAWVGARPVRSPAAGRARGPQLTQRGAGDNLFDRFVRVTKANVNKVLQGLEDPEKVLDQALDDMQGDLIKVRQSYAEVLATQRRLMSQKEQQDQVAQEWYRRAELAVEKGDDELAKEALTRRQAAVSKSNDLDAQISGMTGNVDKLFDSVKQLEEKISQAKDEKEQLIARARTAQTTAKVNEMLSDVSQGSGVGAFERMKEKVETLETRAEVSTGLLPSASAPGGLEDRFKQLEAGNAVADELAALKGKKALPPANDPLDAELEAMRKKLKESSE